MMNRYSLTHKKEYSFKVVSGIAWVTFENDLKDYIYQAGEEVLILKREGVMLISNLSETHDLKFCFDELKEETIIAIRQHF